MACVLRRAVGLPLLGRGDWRGLSLQVANPATILNSIAQRYPNAPRLIMEYVDNAIDDAEEGFRTEGFGKAYPADVRISVLIDPRREEVSVTDNCRGLSPEQLVNIVQTVGESQKRGLPWLNGQFGFGVHAFRAAARTLRIETRRADDPAGRVWAMEVEREQSEGIAAPSLGPPPSLDEQEVQLQRLAGSGAAGAGFGPGLGDGGAGTGTRVTLSGFDGEWLRELTANTVRHEIEVHFERLLARPGLRVGVAERSAAGELVEQDCSPLDYETIEGQGFERQLETRGAGEGAQPVQVSLRVARGELPERAPRFFANGRRINEVVSVPSFMKMSKYKHALWGHPQLIGFIDVTGVLEPVITRDEFRQTSLRRTLYTELLKLEADVNKALAAELERQRVFTLASLEGVLGSILGRVAREDMRASRRLHRQQNYDMGSGGGDDGAPGGSDLPDINDRAEVQADVDKSTAEALERVKVLSGEGKKDDTPTPPPKEPKASLFQVRLVRLDGSGGGAEGGGGEDAQRSRLIGTNVVEINVGHPDFTARLHSTKGRPKFNDRLGSYLAAVLADHYNDLGTTLPDKEKQALLDTFTRLESATRRRMPALQRSVHSFFESGQV